MGLWHRRALSLIHRGGFFASDHRWIILSVVLGVMGLLPLIAEPPLWLNGTASLLAFALLLAEVRDYRRARSDIRFVPRPTDRFEDVEEQLQHNERYRFWRTPNGCIVEDNEMSEAIAAGQMVISMDGASYTLPPELREMGILFQRRHSVGIDFYNGDVLGLNTDLAPIDGTIPASVVLTPAKYIDHLATDIFAMHDVMVGRYFRREFGRRLFIDRRGNLRDFRSSWLLNSIGTSVLAFTTDGKLVVVEQSRRNLSSPGLLAPSGSGTLEPRDLANAPSTQFRDVLAQGALRELHEETGITFEEVGTYYHLGFCRWLEKGGKPEAFTLAQLTIDSHDARWRHPAPTDRPFSLRTEAISVDFSSSDGVCANVPQIILDEKYRNSLSVPLWAGLALAASVARDRATPQLHPLRQILLPE